MTDRNRQAKRRKGDQTHAMQSNFSGVGGQHDNYQSRPPRHSSHDGSLYPSAWNYSQQPNATFTASPGWYAEGTGNVPSHPDFGEESTQSPWHHAGYSPFAERYSHDPLSRNIQSQDMAYGAEGAVDFQGYGGIQPHPPSSLLQHQAVDPSLSSSENDPNMYLRRESAMAGQSTNVELSEDSLTLSPLLEAGPYDYGNVDSLNLDFLKEEMDNVQSNAGPWSSFIPNESPQMPQQHLARQWTGRIGPSDIAPSTYDIVSSSSSYVMVDNPMTPFSRSGIHNNGMDDSVMTARPAHDVVLGFRSYRQEPVTPGLLLQPATPPIGPSNIGLCFGPSEFHPAGFDHDLQPPRMERQESDTPSCITDASSAATTSEIRCDVDGCTAFFHGLYSRGNLARHKRHNHNGPRVYSCVDGLCGRVFRRQDARLKHYRKHHPILATSSPYVARSPRTRLAEGERDLTLSNVSSWT